MCCPWWYQLWVQRKGERKAGGSSVLPAQWLCVHLRPDSQEIICFSQLSSPAEGTAEGTPSQTSPAGSVELPQQGTEHPKTQMRREPHLIPLHTAQAGTEGCSLKEGSCLVYFHPPHPLLTHSLSVPAHSATSNLPLQKQSLLHPAD